MITFIIPAHNEEYLIGATLSSVHATAAGLKTVYEVVVADDASTDATAAVAERHGARVLAVNHRKIAATRNSGAQHARGDLLIFVDADTIVTEAVVRSAIEAVSNGAIGGAAPARFDGHMPLYARVLTQLWIFLQPFVRLGTGCFFFCTRRAFHAVGGFDETLYALEDFALSRRLRRFGVFVILRESVVTSGRNLRAHSAFDALRMVGGLILQGPRFLRRREGLSFWYGGRRKERDSSAPAGQP